MKNNAALVLFVVAFVTANKSLSQVKSKAVIKANSYGANKHVLLQGVWSQSPDSSASFLIKKDHAYYFDGAHAKSVPVKLIGDKIITYFGGGIVITDTILKLTRDSLVFRDEQGKVVRLVKVK